MAEEGVGWVMESHSALRAVARLVLFFFSLQGHVLGGQRGQMWRRWGPFWNGDLAPAGGAEASGQRAGEGLTDEWRGGRRAGVGCVGIKEGDERGIKAYFINFP